MTTGGAASLGHLLGRLGVVEARCVAAVGRRRAAGAPAPDPFRGLVLTDTDLDQVFQGPGPVLVPGPDPALDLLRQVERAAEQAAASGLLVLREVARNARLDDVDVDLLLVALAPDVDARFERVYGYLHDDVTRRRASVGLALELALASPLDGATRRRLSPGGPLVAGGLVLVEEDDRPVLTRSLRVPDRVVAHLLGDGKPRPPLDELVDDSGFDLPDDAPALVRAVDAADGLCYVHDVATGAAPALITSALRRRGRAVLVLDLDRLGPHADPAALAGAVRLEARLTGATVLASPVERLTDRGDDAVRAFTDGVLDGGTAVVLCGRVHWDSRWSSRTPLVTPGPLLPVSDLARVWQAALGHRTPPGLDPAAETAGFRLDVAAVRRTAEIAVRLAEQEDAPLGPEHLRRGARAQGGGRIQHLARRFEPAAGFADLVLPEPVLDQLRDLVAHVVHGRRVREEWGVDSHHRPGTSALFTGASGTGKSRAAEVVAGELGLDLFVVDLSTVVDKYVGETEKHLERLFAEAEALNGVLLFDEADAVFGKRSEVRDSHDRYANTETAYLLQRLERFSGVSVLTSNLRANIDAAFSRRFDVSVDFPVPDVADRRRLWERALGPVLPRADDVDLDLCARRFELTGGHIRGCARTAATLAAARGTPVTMELLVLAVQREYRKLGRLCTTAEFDPWLAGASGVRPG